VLSALVSNGTAEHPNGGILIGNGYIYNADRCTGTAVCNGGSLGVGGTGGAGGTGTATDGANGTDGTPTAS
jgi:hypothetical protein